MKKYWINSIVIVLLSLCQMSYGALIAHYSFDNASDLGHDDSGNGNNLLVNGAIPDFDPSGAIGGASASDGTQGWKTPVGVNSTPSFTFATWINPESITGTYWTQATPSTDGIRTYVSSDKFTFAVYRNGTATTVGGATVAYTGNGSMSR